MIGIGSKLKWFDGKIMHPSSQWKSPSKRRIPRLLVENRALEVGVLVYLEHPWIVFEETDMKAEDIDTTDAIPVEFYEHHYHLLPEKVKRQDTYKWISKPTNALLLFGKDFKYFVKPTTRK